MSRRKQTATPKPPMSYEKAIRCLPSFLFPFRDSMGSSQDLGLLRWKILSDWEKREDTDRAWNVLQLKQLLGWLELTAPEVTHA